MLAPRTRFLFPLGALLVLAAAGCNCGGEESLPVQDAGTVPGPTRTLAGVVVDAEELPVEGARVRVGDDEAPTGADGRFSLEARADAPPTLLVRAEGFVKAERRLEPGGDRAWAGTVVLTRLSAHARVETSGGTVGGPAAGVTVVVPGGAFSRAVTVEVGLIPLGDPLLDDLRLPLAIPGSAAGVIAPIFALSLDAEGEQPAHPLRVAVASAAGLPDGTKVPVGRYDGATGAWVDFGVAVAGSDGSLDFPVGHLSVFAGSLPALPAGDAQPPELDGLRRVPTPFPRGEPRVDPRTGALQVGVELPGLVRRGQEIGLTLFHDSRTPAPRISAPVALPSAAAGEEVVVDLRTSFAQVRAQVVSSEASTPLEPSVVVGDLGVEDHGAATAATLRTGTYRVVTQAIRAVEGQLHLSKSESFTAPERGEAIRSRGAPVAAPAKVMLRNVEVGPVAVDDRSASPFGPGWHLRGLTRLVQPWCQDGAVTLAGGFETPAIAFERAGRFYLARVEQQLVEAGLDLDEALGQPPLLAFAGRALFVGLRMTDRAEVWRLDAEGPARRVAGGATPSGPPTCKGPLAGLHLERLTGLAPEPGGNGVLFASENCIFHLELDGSATLLVGDKGDQAPPAAHGAKLDEVEFMGELVSVTFGRAPGVWLIQDYRAGTFLTRDGKLESLRTRIYDRDLVAAIDASGTLHYTAEGKACLYRFVDGLDDAEVFPTCRAGLPEAPGDGPAETARVGQIASLVFDADGNLWFVDATFGALRRLGLDGRVATVAGGKPGDLQGVGGPVAEATLGPVHEVAAGADDEVALAGPGSVLRFARAAGDPLQGLGAADHSTLARQADGSWLRLLADGTRERYDARGLLVRVFRPDARAPRGGRAVATRSRFRGCRRTGPSNILPDRPRAYPS